MPDTPRGVCPSDCDPDCDIGCHEHHAVPWRRHHDPNTCPGNTPTPEPPMPDDTTPTCGPACAEQHTYQPGCAQCTPGGWVELLSSLPDLGPAELTTEEARAEVDRLATELYRAQDAVAFIAECCDIADREDRTVTTTQVRRWLEGPLCGRQLLATGTTPRTSDRTETGPTIARAQASTPGAADSMADTEPAGLPVNHHGGYCPHCGRGDCSPDIPTYTAMSTALARVREKATEWSGLAPADDWGLTPGDTTLADAGRYLLALLDGPAERSTQ